MWYITHLVLITYTVYVIFVATISKTDVIFC